MFRIEIARPARRYLERLDAPTQRRIVTAIDELSQNPLEGDVRRLHGEPNLYRRRVGDLRILFRLEISERVIRIEAIRPRGEAYKPQAGGYPGASAPVDFAILAQTGSSRGPLPAG